MKRLFTVFTALLIVCALLSACAQTAGTSSGEPAASPDEKGASPAEIVVFAAASMTETLEELAEKYEAEQPGVKLTFNFDSSGTLKTQIEEGAVCDLFISAAQKQMNALDEGGYIDSDTRVDLLENKVALCVAENSDSGIKTYEDMKAHLEAGDILMAIGNEDVPVGQYTQKIFAYCGLDEAALVEKGVLTYGSNVKEVTAQIREGAADCGIIYQTDAYSAGLDVADTATEEMCGRVVYPAAVLSDSKAAVQAKAFLDYLQTAEASAVFEKVGFTPLAGK